MPKDLPPRSICYDYWRPLTEGGHLDRVNRALVMADRERCGREASPTLAVVDAQSVECDAPRGERGERGYDGGKKVRGRERHVAVGGGGRPLGVGATGAGIQDRDGGSRPVERLVRLYPWIETVAVDAGYKRRSIEAVRSMANRAVEVVERPDYAKGFVLLPERRRVERSIGVPTTSRRLKLDHESLVHVSAAAMLFASITRLLASMTTA